MPFIQIKILEGMLSGRKQEMIKRLTDAWVFLEGEQEREYLGLSSTR